jgi:hypothetical protein
VELPVGKIWKEVRESQTIFAAAGDTQAKPTRVSGGLDILVITGQTIVGPSDYILRLVFYLFLFRSRSRSFHRPIPARDIKNCSEWLPV